MRQIIDLFGWGNSTEALAGVSLILTVITLLLVILIGFVMNGLERVELAILRKIFGHNFALIFHNRILIMGTVIHELAHAIFGLLTGARILEISFWDDEHDTLGHVTYQARGPFFMRAIQHAVSACAPVIVGIALGAVIIYVMLHITIPIWGHIIGWYLLFSIANHMSMSNADIKNYFRGSWIFVPPIFLIFMELCKNA